MACVVGSLGRMDRTSRTVRLAGVLAATIAGAAPAGAASAPTRVRLDGVGPITLGMTRADAAKTGWLSNPHRNCPDKGTVANGYELHGAKAPGGLGASVAFAGGTLRAISLEKGARTQTGVTVGVSTLTRMASAYRAAGYQVKAKRYPTVGGTYVTVRRKGIIVVQGFGTGKLVQTLGLPFIPVCA